MSAGPTSDRTKAERCFAVARSTTHDGERDAAISRGKAICERAGLPLDDFDIPGRQRQARPTSNRSAFYHPADDLFRPAGASPFAYEFDREFREHLRRKSDEVARRGREALERAAMEAQVRAAEEAAKRAAERADARPGETAYDASRRNFDEETKAAKERDAKRDLHKRAKKAADLLAPRGVRAYPQGDGWIVEFRGELVAATAFEVIQLHREIAEREVMRAGWSPTWGERRICPKCDQVMGYAAACACGVGA